MHHYEHPDGHINYNSDLSGEVQVVNSRGEECWVSGMMLVNFVANYIAEHISPRMEVAKDRLNAVTAPTVAAETDIDQIRNVATEWRLDATDHKAREAMCRICDIVHKV